MIEAASDAGRPPRARAAALRALAHMAYTAETAAQLAELGAPAAAAGCLLAAQRATAAHGASGGEGGEGLVAAAEGLLERMGLRPDEVARQHERALVSSAPGAPCVVWGERSRGASVRQLMIMISISLIDLSPLQVEVAASKSAAAHATKNMYRKA